MGCRLDCFVHLQNKAMFCPFMKQSKTQESGLSDKDDWAFFYLSEYTLVVCVMV